MKLTIWMRDNNKLELAPIDYQFGHDILTSIHANDRPIFITVGPVGAPTRVMLINPDQVIQASLE